MSSSEEKIWDKPDPKIKWALNILDGDGYEKASIVDFFWYPMLGATGGSLSSLAGNWRTNRPLYTAIHITAFAGVAGWLTGVWFRNRLSQRNANEIAAIKHYVMLHPEKFPEPELKKFGDKEIFLDWPINR